MEARVLVKAIDRIEINNTLDYPKSNSANIYLEQGFYKYSIQHLVCVIVTTLKVCWLLYYDRALHLHKLLIAAI